MLRACCVLPLLLLCLAPPSWADQDQDQDGTAVKGFWSLKRADPVEDDATFFAVRGKKSGDDFAFRSMKPNSLFGMIPGKRSMKPNSLFSAIPGKRFLKPNSLFSAIPGKRFLKPNSLFSAIPGKRFLKPNSLFSAIPGKRSLKPNSLFSAIPGKRFMKPNSLFGAIHKKRMRIGKKSMKPNGLFGVRLQRAIKPNGLFSVAKRNSLVWNPSPSSLHMMMYGMGHGAGFGWKSPGDLYIDMKDENEYEQDDLEDSADVTDEPEDLDEVGPAFWKQFGLTKPDKKEAAGNFWATRGKRDFWASRGKRGGDDWEPEVEDLNQATTN